jgi:cytochrome c oxidase assembly protein subunit 15
MAIVFRRLVLFTACFAFIVVVVGAYVRLEDAGLGCPDWPGCYGQWIGVPAQDHELAQAKQEFDRAVDVGRAKKEMFHRYIAGTLGLLILAIAIIAWRGRTVIGQSPLLPTVLVMLVALQAALGMWTVTMLLKPVIVTLHLLGGMATLGLLTWLAVRQLPLNALASESRRLRPWAGFALAALMDFLHGFHLVRELGVTAAGAPLSHDALVAIQWMHRLGALVVLLAVGGMALVALRSPGFRSHGLVVLALLLMQVGLGIANVLLRLPLALAVAHNAGAALLLVALVVLNFALFPKSPP